MLFKTIEENFARVTPNVEFCSLRAIEQRGERLSVRQDVVQPLLEEHDLGVMITVLHGGALGYAATSDLTEPGLRRAVAQAMGWVETVRTQMAFVLSAAKMPHPSGRYTTPVEKPWRSLSLVDKLDLLRACGADIAKAAGAQAPLVVDWSAGLHWSSVDSLYLTNGGGRVEQHLEFLTPDLAVTANRDNITQTRSMSHGGESQQGGLEVLDRIGFVARPARLTDEVLQLLHAPNCPSGKMSLLLMPDQMMLQIHESIGHPLELDRILGDERNYAGTSFVKPEMFGSYQYGSELLNVSYDPTIACQLASYGFDDEGLAADKRLIIENGILQRPLGGIVSQARAGMAGVANTRATSWNRPPIDRMANLNVEPGNQSLAALIAGIEDGVLMRTNRSWSIDDSRNKFQFGCEWGQRIEHGELKEVVRTPNYRGVSATFWRDLAAVGDAQTVEILGTPNCGKGEPNQAIRVGHASPACVFNGVDVFGGE